MTRNGKTTTTLLLGACSLHVVMDTYIINPNPKYIIKPNPKYIKPNPKYIIKPNPKYIIKEVLLANSREGQRPSPNLHYALLSLISLWSLLMCFLSRTA
jgi:hypothetical protein